MPSLARSSGLSGSSPTSISSSMESPSESRLSGSVPMTSQFHQEGRRHRSYDAVLAIAVFIDAVVANFSWAGRCAAVNARTAHACLLSPKPHVVVKLSVVPSQSLSKLSRLFPMIWKSAKAEYQARPSRFLQGKALNRRKYHLECLRESINDIICLGIAIIIAPVAYLGTTGEISLRVSSQSLLSVTNPLGWAH